MKFLMFIKHEELGQQVQPPPALMKAMGEFVGRMMSKGYLKDTGGLESMSKAVRIASKGGQLRTMDGPFAEAKEVIGGYALVEVPTREEGLAVAQEFMELHRIHWPEFECVSEVRAVQG